MTNGQIPLAELTAVPGGYLRADVAEAWLALVAACAADTGITLTITQPDGAYRTLAQQEAAWAAYNAGSGAPAARPGYSPHGLGEAIDVWNWAQANPWLTANAARFGFVRDVAGENWHFHKTGTYTPPPRRKKNIMLIAKGLKPGKPNEGDYYLAIGGQLVPYKGTQAQADKLGPAITMAELGCTTWAQVEALFAAPSVKIDAATAKLIGQSVPAANLIIAGTARPEGLTK